MRLARLLVVLCFAVCGTAVARADTAAQVMFAYGETHALRSGRILQLHAGSTVESGDQLHTGVDSYLQIRFTDWGVMSLRPRTDFVIDQYAYEPRVGGLERAFFSLLSGGVRSLTGLIGHRNRSNYRMRTTMTSIGIRGTHYSVLICNQDCKLDDGRIGEDGVYGGVIEGRIAVSPYGGAALEREFGAGEYFRLASANSIPEPFFAPPPFFWDKREPQARASGKTFAGIPWKPGPGTAPSIAGGEVTDIGGSLLRTDGSLTLSPIIAPVLNQVSPVLAQTGSTLGTTVGALAAPVTPLLGSTVGALTPVVAPVTAMLGSTAGSLVNPVLAPIAPALGSTVGAVVNPVLAPVVPVIAPTVGAVVNPVVAPILAPVEPVVAPVAPVVAPIVAPVTPVVAPVVPVVAPVIAPVAPVVAPVAPVVTPIVTPPPPAVTLPTVPTLPVVGGLLPKK